MAAHLPQSRSGSANIEEPEEFSVRREFFHRVVALESAIGQLRQDITRLKASIRPIARADEETR